jgi:uncharacterized protein (TIGR02246 family)
MRNVVLFVAALGLVVGLGVLSLAQDTAADEEAIQQLGQRWEEAWANRDAKALAELYTEDADGISESGETVTGRMAIEEYWAQNFENLPESAQLEAELTFLRFIRPDIAIGDGVWAVTGGTEGMPAEGLYTEVYVKKDGQWLHAAGRARIPMMPPGAEEE